MEIGLIIFVLVLLLCLIEPRLFVALLALALASVPIVVVLWSFFRGLGGA